MSPESLTLAGLVLIAEAVLGIDAGRLLRVIDVASAESALAAPFAGSGDVELYPDVPVKAAILCSRLIRNHPLPDGNKRVAHVARLWRGPECMCEEALPSPNRTLSRTWKAADHPVASL